MPMLANETFKITGKRMAELLNAENELKKAKELIKRQQNTISLARLEKKEQISITQRMKKEYLASGDKAKAYLVTLLRKRLFLA